MKAKKVRATVIILIIVAAVAVAVWFESKGNKQSLTEQAVAQLTNSVSYADGTISFTIPAEEREWDIWISGRMEAEGFGGMSVHYLEEQSMSGSWEAGKTYSFEVSDAVYTELTLSVYEGEEEILIDLLDALPDDLKI